MAASFRASTLCPDARAPPRFGAFWSPGALLRNLWPSTRERSPGFTASLLPNRAIRHNLGASATVWFPLPVTAGGFHMVGSLATLSPRHIHRFNLSAYSSVLCLLAHRTFPRGNALPVGYLARRASTRIGLQPIRSGDYPATPTPPLQGGEYARLNSFTGSMTAHTPFFLPQHDGLPCRW